MSQFGQSLLILDLFLPRTCPDAYAIFETETARDAAVEAISSIEKGAYTTCRKLLGGHMGQPLMPHCDFAGGCFQRRGGVPWQHTEAERLACGAADGEVAELRQHGPGGQGQACGSRHFGLRLVDWAHGKARCFLPSVP